MNILCNSKPHKLNYIECNNEEFMFWLYCPVKIKGMDEIVIPDTLKKWKGVLDASLKDFKTRGGDLLNSYVYLTAKSLVVTPESLGQRGGWHLDGFLTCDTNYIWSDVNTTTFTNYEPVVTSSHSESLIELERLDKVMSDFSYRASPNTLYRLDSKVVHKPSKPDRPMFRNFVKVSISDKEYSHSGSSVNHSLGVKKSQKVFIVSDRNCPI